MRLKSKKDIKTAIIKEYIKVPTYSVDESRIALCNYRKLDLTKQCGKRKLIDTFINAVYVFDRLFQNHIQR